MTPQHSVAIQEGSGARRALVYLLHVGDAKPSQRYQLGTFDAVREACGPDPLILVRGDDGTGGGLPVADALGSFPVADPRSSKKALRVVLDGRGDFDVSRVVVGGWSAGVRGIRRFLTAREAQGAWRSDREHPVSWASERLAGVVACDGLHAPWAARRSAVSQTLEDGDAGRGAPYQLPLGPSEVFREYVDRARAGERCPTCSQSTTALCNPARGCAACGGAGWRYPRAFVLTHCMQDYMEDPKADPRYLSTYTVARELTGFRCEPDPADTVTAYGDQRLRVYTFPGPRVDYDGHVRQLREALPLGLRTMREWGLFAP